MNGIDVQRSGLAPALRDELGRALSPIDPGEHAPAWLIGLGTPEAQHLQTLGRVAGQLPAQDAQVEWGSISKTVTAMLLACAAVRGDLDIDEPLCAVLDEAAHLPRWLTLERLATHTSCLRAQPPGIYRSWWRDRKNPWAHFSAGAVLAGLRKTKPPREKPPPLAWRYSNFGYALLGAALERRTGQSYQSLVQAWLAGPFGLSSLHVGGAVPSSALWRIHGGDGRPTVPWQLNGPMAAAGALRGTVHDLLRWGLLVANPPSELRPAVELMRARRVALAKPVGRMVGFCLGWSICKASATEREVLAHEGATGGSLSVLAVTLDDAPSAVAFARNQGLSVRSLLDRRTRAIEQTLFDTSNIMSRAAQATPTSAFPSLRAESGREDTPRPAVSASTSDCCRSLRRGCLYRERR